MLSFKNISINDRVSIFAYLGMRQFLKGKQLMILNFLVLSFNLENANFSPSLLILNKDGSNLSGSDLTFVSLSPYKRCLILIPDKILSLICLILDL